jgi:Transposase IS66 family
MKDELAKINLDEFNLDPPIRKLFEQLLNHIEILSKENLELKEENQQLRDEIARLKGEKGKPKIKANKKGEGKSAADLKKQEQTKRAMKKEVVAERGERIKIDREEEVKLNRSELPADVKHRGYRAVVIQNIKFESDNVLYSLERMYSPKEGIFYEASLPQGLTGQRYGNELRAFVLRQYFELRTPQEKILLMLKSEGIVISAGAISDIITSKHLTLFEQERKEMVKAGLASTSYQNIDDTGGRENGVNQYVTVICNRHYSSFYTNRRKDAETVAKLLAHLQTTAQIATIPGELKTLAQYIDILLADDAKQFHDQTRIRALCWIHEDRHYKKLNPYFKQYQLLVAKFREQLWDYYAQLKAYKLQPSEQEKARLSIAFDQLFSPTTGYAALDHRIDLTRQKKAQLLVVLDYPEIPLHNNDAELAVREYVVKRKISNGTRTAGGTKSWDVYLSLLATCQKLGVNFYRYLLDRISYSYFMPSLAHLIARQSQFSFPNTFS